MIQIKAKVTRQKSRNFPTRPAGKSVRVGFFESARYSVRRSGKKFKPASTPVADVAARHEFGIGVPERPFFRKAISVSEDSLVDLCVREVDPSNIMVSASLAGRVGELLKGTVQDFITLVSTPPNAPRTIAAKGSSNPLIDTGVLRLSVTYEVISNGEDSS